MSIIITKNSITPSNTPSPGTLVTGELAINVVDGKLFYGSGSAVREFSSTINTGSLLTTASFNSYTSSTTAQFAGTASYASQSLSASYASSSTSASYASSSTSASYATTASYALNAGGTPGGSNTQIQFNANNAFSGSPNFTFNSGSNTLTLTGSLNITGSTTQIGNQTITGSLTVTQNISASSFTGSLLGTASFATTASYALTASYAMNGGGTPIDTSIFVTTSSFNTLTSSFNTFTSSYNTGSFSGSFTGSLFGTATTASYVTASNVVGTVLSASYALTASYAMNSGGGGGGYTVVSVSSTPYNAAQTSGDIILLVDAAAAGATTINLPTAVSNTAKFTVKKIDGGTNTVTVDANSTETIDGGATASILIPSASITLISNNSNWFII